MHAIIQDGSRQYRVREGDVVQLDYRDVDVGTQLELTRVLLYQSGEDVRIGQPVVEGARVTALVVDHPSVKLTIQKYRRRKNYRRFKGHRQPYTAVRIRSILLPGQQEQPASKAEEPPAEAPQAEQPPAEAPQAEQPPTGPEAPKETAPAEQPRSGE
jgi:large subunit ribosomal protein L21